MKILFVLEYYHPHVGGVEKLFKTLAEALTSGGHEVMIISNKFDPLLKSNEIINGVRIKRLNLWNRFLFSFFSLGSIIKHGRDFDLIHTTSYNAALPASIAGKILGKKVLITFHEVWGNLWFKLPFLNVAQKTLFYFFEKLILNLPYHKFIAVSNATKQRLISHGIKVQNIIRIYNGIEYPIKSKEDVVPDKKFTFTFLGRLGVSKGLDLLIPAAAKFIHNFPNSNFQIISPDKPKDLNKKVKNLIKKHSLEKKILWFKNMETKKINERLLASHCMVIPSYSEGFCFVAAEAVAMGIPIISSDKTALKEVVSGAFIKLKELNSEEIFQALVQARAGKFKKTEIKKFQFKNTLEEYLKFYQSLS